MASSRTRTDAPPVAAVSGPQGLQDFIDDNDRLAPLLFVGRTREIDRTSRIVERVRAGSREGCTQVITAAPGAGKTALLRELARQLGNKKNVQVVQLNPEDFNDRALAVQNFLKQADDQAAREASAVRTETKGEQKQVSSGLSGVVQLHGGTQSSRSVQRSGKPVSFSDAFNLIQNKDKLVVVLVDEAQYWGADTNDGTSSLLSEAHQNKANLPLLIVAAGLGDTRERLRRRGVSKLATDPNPLVLGPLCDDDMCKVVEAFFDRFHIQGDPRLRAEWTQAIIERTNGWPRHLTNALRGAAQVLVEGDGDLEQSSLSDACDHGAAFRQQYYFDQVTPLLETPQLLSAVFTAMPDGTGASRFALKTAIDKAYEAYPSLADEMGRGEVVTKLLHQGLIQDYGQDRYDCPIPSMRDYVETFCAERGAPIGSSGGTVPSTPLPEPSGAMGG